MNRRARASLAAGLLAAAVASSTSIVVANEGASASGDATNEVSVAPDQLAYAEAHDVSLEIAAQNLELQGLAGDLEGQLAVIGEKWFAGLWVEHTPTFRVVVASVDPASTDLKEAIARSAVGGITSIRSADHSLQGMRAEAARLQDRADGRYRVEIDVKSNQLILATQSPEDTDRYLADARIDLPSNAIVQEDDRRIHLTADIYGGRTLSLTSGGSNHCTRGFTVLDGLLYRYMTTAAHCLNNLTIQPNVPLTWSSAAFYGPHDEQLHEIPPGSIGRNWAYDGVTGPNLRRNITGKISRTNQVIDAFYCKYGYKSGYTCGYLKSKDAWCGNPSPTNQCMRLERPNYLLVRGGDSGGPVMNNWNALGLVHACITSQPDCVAGDPMLYIAINYVESGLGVTVLTYP